MCFSIEPFTLDTSSATSCDTFSFNQSENGIPMTLVDITGQSQYYSGTGCDGMGMCCEKKTMIG